MVAPVALSEEDLVAARAELAAGRPFTVWFTPAAVGVPANGSARVVSIDDVAEGDFIQVRPAGSRDALFCSPSELTRTRPPRKQAKKQPDPAPGPVAPAESAPRPPAPLPEKSAPPKPPPLPEKAPDRPRSGGARPAARPAEVTVTLNATTDGEWTVEVMIGKKRVVRPTPVQAGDVAKAARSLPSPVAEAIESSLEAARHRQVERVERLRAELDAAQRALQELSG
ncbi:hypothetical protein GCM10009609_20090 [Pseudonocardia aurantiaca]|uniref:DUF6319 family protein n=1 Tax=Pseudonocardia aurantiaca TaxID=75290 RepID=A0ABW4FE73_9PSEU